MRRCSRGRSRSKRCRFVACSVVRCAFAARRRTSRSRRRCRARPAHSASTAASTSIRSAATAHTATVSSAVSISSGCSTSRTLKVGLLSGHYDVEVDSIDVTPSSVRGVAQVSLDRTVIDSIRVHPSNLRVRFADGKMIVDSATDSNGCVHGGSAWCGRSSAGDAGLTPVRDHRGLARRASVDHLASRAGTGLEGRRAGLVGGQSEDPSRCSERNVGCAQRQRRVDRKPAGIQYRACGFRVTEVRSAQRAHGATHRNDSGERRQSDDRRRGDRQPQWKARAAGLDASHIQRSS